MTKEFSISTLQETFTIGELAKQLGISTRTIRYYEERDLISPLRSDGGQRVYTRRDRGRLKLILRAKIAGLDLAESKEVLDLYDILPSDEVEQAQAKKLKQMISRRLNELEAKINEMTKLRNSLQEMLIKLPE
ncbi:MAG: MerR family transcriptional regulator [Chloroflexota bacterium]